MLRISKPPVLCLKTVQPPTQCTLKADSHIACRTYYVPLPCRVVNSHMPSRGPAMLRECRVLRESPRGSRNNPNC
jgi:hypothetical protein